MGWAGAGACGFTLLLLEFSPLVVFPSDVRQCPRFLHSGGSGWIWHTVMGPWGVPAPSGMLLFLLSCADAVLTVFL